MKRLTQAIGAPIFLFSGMACTPSGATTPDVVDVPTPILSAMPTPQAAATLGLPVLLDIETPYFPTKYLFDEAGGAIVFSGETLVVSPTGAIEKKPGSIVGMGTSEVLRASNGHFFTSITGAAHEVTADGQVVRTYEAPSGDWAYTPLLLDRDENVWVGYDFGQATYKYARDGKRLLELPIPALRGLRLNREGNIIAGGSSEIHEIAPDGTILRHVKVEGQVNMTAIQLDRQGNVWSTNQSDRRIIRIGTDDQVTFYRPISAPTMGVLLDAQDRVWFYDSDSIHRMAPDGTLAASYRFPERMTTIAMDPLGNLWTGYQPKTTEQPNGRLIKYATADR